MPIQTLLAALLRSLVVLALAATASSQEMWSFGERPGWVQPTDVDLTRRSEADYALVEYQANYLLEEPEAFQRWIVRFDDEVRIQQGSQLEILFDPTYQRLALHEVTLIRGDERIDQRNDERVRVIQRQTELDYQLYDGTHSLLLFLEDVRKGDVLEYSYTLSGANPVFGDHRAGELTALWGIPVDQIAYRVLWPRDRTLYVRPHGDVPLVGGVIEHADHTEYTWRGAEDEYAFDEGGYPSWYDPLPWIQLSDFADWGEVARWGTELFATETPSVELEKRITDLRASGTNDEERLLEALRFVQDEIRYLGIEIGPGCYDPTEPNVVLQRRFGDCKDKSLLLITLLRGVGIEAYPVLVSSYYRGHVADWHPSPLAFNHAIVTARLDGRDYWFDPTILVQRGDLESFATASFGRGLVLKEGASGLTEIAAPSLEEPLTAIHQRLILPESEDEPVEFTVVTNYVGLSADDQRAEFQSLDPEILGREYAEYYAHLYPSIEMLNPPAIVDRPDENRVEVTEWYSIPEFWEEGTGTLLAQELAPLFNAPSNAERTSPLAMAHPIHTGYVIDAVIDIGWGIEPESHRIETPAGIFTFDTSVRRNRLRLRYSYRSTADHVLPQDLPAYIEACDEIQELLEYPIVTPEHAELPQTFEGVHWPVIMTGLFTFLLGSVVLLLLSLLNSRFPMAAPAESGPSGLGGLLLIVMVVVLASPLAFVVGFLANVADFGPDSWNRLTSSSSTQYDSGWAPYILARTFLGSLAMLFALACIPTFFLRMRCFTLILLVRGALEYAYHWTGYAYVTLRDIDEGPSVLHSAAWILSFALTIVVLCYMVASRRVRNTFVN